MLGLSPATGSIQQSLEHGLCSKPSPAVSWRGLNPAGLHSEV